MFSRVSRRSVYLAESLSQATQMPRSSQTLPRELLSLDCTLQCGDLESRPKLRTYRNDVG